MLKRRWTGEPFDAEAAAAVIERIFLAALGSFRMWRGMDHRCGALGATVSCTVHSTVAWSANVSSSFVQSSYLLPYMCFVRPAVEMVQSEK